MDRKTDRRHVRSDGRCRSKRRGGEYHGGMIVLDDAKGLLVIGTSDDERHGQSVVRKGV